MTSDHYDAFAVLGVALLMLMFVEMRLRALFARHEVREEKMHAVATMLADSAAATAREASRHIDELRVETNSLRLDINNLSELVRVHESKIVAVESRIMRASLSVPRRGDS